MALWMIIRNLFDTIIETLTWTIDCNYMAWRFPRRQSPTKMVVVKCNFLRRTSHKVVYAAN